MRKISLNLFLCQLGRGFWLWVKIDMNHQASIERFCSSIFRCSRSIPGVPGVFSGVPGVFPGFAVAFSGAAGVFQVVERLTEELTQPQCASLPSVSHYW